VLRKQNPFSQKDGIGAVKVVYLHMKHAFDNLKRQQKNANEKLNKFLKALKLDSLTLTQFLEFIQNNRDFITLKLSPESVRELDQIILDLKELPDKLNTVSIKSNDIDIFFLGSEIPHRMYMGTTDIVHTKCKTVEDLLLNFDLPCCRAAFNSRHDFWISAQCLYSLLTGTYPVPTYVQNKDKFIDLLKVHRNGDPMHVNEESLFERIQSRIAKYEERGFKVNWIETNEVLPWIKNRFHYGSWKVIHP